MLSVDSTIARWPPLGQPLWVVFSGGVTGGHLMPGLALAQWLRRAHPAAEIAFAGVGRDWERRLVIQHGFAYHVIPAAPLPRRSGDLWSFARTCWLGHRRAARWLRAWKPRVVVGLGGFASVPAARQAARLGIPLLLLEQNVLPGRATRWLAPCATEICLAFEPAREHLPNRRIQVTGTPLRPGFGPLPYPRRPRRLIVLGGSGGAAALNTAVPGALAALRHELAGWTIVHQAGHRDVETTAARYAAAGLRAEIVPFLDRMAEQLSRATLAVSRAGGTTLAELAACRVPAVLVPLSTAADDHQRLNARWFADRQAAVVVDEAQSDWFDLLSAALRRLLRDEPCRTNMSEAIGRLARPAATEEVARRILTAAGHVAAVRLAA